MIRARPWCVNTIVAFVDCVLKMQFDYPRVRVIVRRIDLQLRDITIKREPIDALDRDAHAIYSFFYDADLMRHILIVTVPLT